MPLPDLSHFENVPRSIFRAIGQGLASLGLSLAKAQPIVEAARHVEAPIRRPIRRFHLRRLVDPAGLAMRMLLFRDPVPEAEARAALGAIFSPMMEIGLLSKVHGADGEGVVSPFVLGIIDDLFVLSDDLALGGDAVMGLGESTVTLCRAAFPAGDGKVEAALDLGCGAGTAALLLSRRARRAVGTDINPRAITLARANAALNGITNVELRQGDLFAPVAGETFDLIVSQPPFVPAPDGVGASAFLHGGRRGDELSLRLFADLSPHLSSRGRALVMVEWPDDGSEPPADRVRAAVGPDALHVLSIEGPSVSPDGYAASYAAAAHPLLDQSFEDEALRLREHLDRMKIRGLSLSLTVLEPAKEAPAFTDAVASLRLADAALTSDRLDKLMAARLVARDPTRLLASRLRVPAGTVLAQEQIGPGAEAPSTLEARLPATCLAAPIGLTVDLLGLITTVHEASSVQAGIERFAELTESPVEDAMRGLLSAVAEALRYGLLEIEAPTGTPD